MKRRLLNFLTVSSLLLLLASVALWARSYRVCDMAGLTLGRQSLWATSKNGTLELELLSWQTAEGVSWRRFAYPAAPTGRQAARRRAAGAAGTPSALRFDAYRATTGRGTPRRGVIFPHWVLLLPSILLPAAWLVGRRRRKRWSRRGLCAACGYDLRATPGRCPECSTISSPDLDRA